MGVEEFKRQVEERLGRPILPPRIHQPFLKNIDDFTGWVKGDDGLYSHTIFIENGMNWSSNGLADVFQDGWKTSLSFKLRLACLRLRDT
jgi:sulfite reductase beta subunit-like hemoprotein